MPVKTNYKTAHFFDKNISFQRKTGIDKPLIYKCRILQKVTNFFNFTKIYFLLEELIYNLCLLFIKNMVGCI